MNDLAQRVLEHWNRLKSKHGWAIIEAHNEQRFLQDVTNQLYQTAKRFTFKEIEARITEAYWSEVYTAFNLNWGATTPAEQEQALKATEEIWQTARRCSYIYRDIYPPEDMAQRVLVALIIKRNTIRAPGALLAWIIWEVRAIVKGGRAKIDSQRIYIAERATTLNDTVSNDTQVQTLLHTELIKLLQTILSERHFNIIYKTIIEGLPPRIAAEDLGMAAHQLRVEKSRALNILRQDRRIKDWLGDSPNG